MKVEYYSTYVYNFLTLCFGINIIKFTTQIHTHAHARFLMFPTSVQILTNKPDTHTWMNSHLSTYRHKHRTNI